MSEIVALAKELSTIGFPTLLVLILIGSYMNVWVWGKAYREMKADYEARLAALEVKKLDWQNIALSAVGLAEKVTETSGKHRRG